VKHSGPMIYPRWKNISSRRELMTFRALRSPFDLKGRGQLDANSVPYGSTDDREDPFTPYQRIYPRGLKLVDYVNRQEVDVDMVRNVVGRTVDVSALVTRKIKEDKHLQALAANSEVELNGQTSINPDEPISHSEEEVDAGEEPLERKDVLELNSEHIQKSKLDILESITILAWMLGKVNQGEEHFLRWTYLCTKFRQYHGDILENIERDLAYFSLDSNTDGPVMSCIETVLRNHNYVKADISKWIKCFESRSLKEALQHMTPEDQWPQFLALYTLKRNAKSSIDAYEAIRMYQRALPNCKANWQMPMFIRALRICKAVLPDYIPIITRIFILHALPEAKTQTNYNQMLWQLSSFGTTLHLDYSKFLSEAQRIVVADMKKQSNIHIDTKGYLALGYTLSVVAPDKARIFVDVVKKHDYPYSKEELLALTEQDSHGLKKVSWGRFPYLHGVYALELSLARNSIEAFRIFDSVPKSYRISTLYGVLLTRLRNVRELTVEVAQIIWQHIKEDKVKLSPFLVLRLLQAFEHSPEKSDEIKQAAEAQNVHIGSGGLGAHFLYQLAKKSPVEAISVLDKIPQKTLKMYEMLMKAQLTLAPSGLWDTYCQMKKDGFEPSIKVLVLICQAAAANPVLQWGTMLAAQQAVVEFKNWVRGANIDGSDAQDVFKVYPTGRLLHSYIIMLGRAGYDAGLLDVLPWMERIKFVPDRTLLCAIIHYSPNGKYLLKHGSNVGGEWPTENEMELYRSMNNL
jgi:hypothetical protein